ncbi:tRNA (guanine-N7-)-methyltransferase [Stanieria sp. NIES-3757]|nr:tRNA (guanine-N7-)-methyltransferase [Stanieria sp. NIES-3757]
MPKVRIRQHVNPLSRNFQQPIQLPDWNTIYQNPNLPLHLDIGCARGKFLLQMAQLQPEINFLGIEIRHALVKDANQTKDELGLTNLHYLFGNINTSASLILNSFPTNTLKFITIQFPDPWFKKKHNKRRVVQPELVNILVDYLVEDGRIFLQSDIEEIAIEMRERFGSNSALVQQHQTTWLDDNPLPVSTERELYVLADNLPVYRVLYKKKLTN